MTTKRVTPQSIIGQLGANLIERIVLRMKYIWRPLNIFDVGIDGEVEICDPVTGEATHNVLRVQAKATTQPFQAETSASFEYTCDAKDPTYWLRGNSPVILIVCRPDTDEAYWVSIKDYFKELATQKTRKVYFNKQRDRFDASSAPYLTGLALPKDSGIYFAPLVRPELLYTNLLKVHSLAPQIYVADTDFRRRGEVWAKFNSMGAKAGPEWILNNKRIVSFRNLEESPYDATCDLGTLESFETSEWADSDDGERQRQFVELLHWCLRERTWLLGLRFHKDHDYYFFPASKSLTTRRIVYQSLKLRVPREVFKQYKKKRDPIQNAYCRHSAFAAEFLRLADGWYLEITPTYHFTSNVYWSATF